MLIIRQATTADTPSLIRLRAAWVAEQTGVSTEDPDFETDYRAWQENNARTMFVADLHGTLIGMLNLMVFERMPKPGKKSTCWVYLGNAFVAADYRNCGVGGQLLEAASQFSQSIKAARIVLSPSAESKTFYARYGFAPAEELLVKRFEYES
ncbi:GNAT family N-acetyltransferase [Pseudarthrobacter sp. SSS035]|uniref:GNAT family N-acetyltransferase n=1 Tax=Pseudarthrobacter sp. SSS035 TaxID=2931399 RepID=UPI00200C9C3A|nr:GNAT family N-acetyltransferase [Pseudarthrobacter sp. SSS035]